MSFKKVTLAGGGVLGSQIAYQTAYKGFDVTIWLRSPESVERAKEKIERLHGIYLKSIDAMAASEGVDPRTFCRGLVKDQKNFSGMSQEEADLLKKNADDAYNNIKYVTDMDEAFGDADLVIEAMAENPRAKIEFYKELAGHLPEKTILATNSSTMLPSTFAEYTGRPEKYLALHFANSIWKNNTAEVMSSGQTGRKYFDKVISFANDIRMIALPVEKEKSGYLLNSMLVPFLLSGLDLYANGVSDPKSIDLAWKHGTGSPKGPFEIFDTVGLTTAMNIVEQYQKVPGLLTPFLRKMMLPYNFKGMKAILQKYIDEGKLGMASGEGFYKWN